MKKLLFIWLMGLRLLVINGQKQQKKCASTLINSIQHKNDTVYLDILKCYHSSFIENMTEDQFIEVLKLAFEHFNWTSSPYIRSFRICFDVAFEEDIQENIYNFHGYAMA